MKNKLSPRGRNRVIVAAVVIIAALVLLIFWLAANRRAAHPVGTVEPLPASVAPTAFPAAFAFEPGAEVVRNENSYPAPDTVAGTRTLRSRSPVMTNYLSYWTYLEKQGWQLAAQVIQTNPDRTVFHGQKDSRTAEIEILQDPQGETLATFTFTERI
ncbi:MAG: hypothetical protein HY978_03060 [Candidatus Liptonbacteria bacterium]|nr:hypothetical protein [Candidatus Liptonbacteria bacterium]